jgi:hypothetical protein
MVLNLLIYFSSVSRFGLNLVSSSVEDPLHFGMDPDPRTRTSD